MKRLTIAIAVLLILFLAIVGAAGGREIEPIHSLPRATSTPLEPPICAESATRPPLGLPSAPMFWAKIPGLASRSLTKPTTPTGSVSVPKLVKAIWAG